MSEAYVTLATTDAYCMGCLVVGKCLRRHGTTKSLVVLITPSVSTEARLSLENVFDEVIVVDVLDSRDRAHLSLLGRPELGITFTKLHCWTLTRYTKCVFLDADTLVLCNVDELFEREELSASPDPGWPDCFNSGVFVFRPSLETHSRLLEHANVHGSFDGGDQGLLNSFFSDWAVKDIHKHLPFIYNLSANAIYTYLPAFHKYGQQAKIVHFLGRSKPWQLPSNQHSLSGADPNRNLEKYLHLWWAEYYSQSQSHVSGSHELKNVLLIESPSQPLASSSSHTTTYPQSQISDPESLRNKETTLTQSPDLLNLNENCSSACHLMEEKPQVQSDTEVKSAGESENLGASEIREPPVTLDGKVLGAEAAEDFSPDVQEATLHTPPDESPSEISEHRRRWEEGHIDYMGRDAFENIRIKLDKFLK